MEYIFQFGRILLFCFLGELLHRWIPLSIPASIYGLLLLLAALKLGVLKVEKVRKAGGFLIKIMPILFVPAAVGVMDLWDDLSAMLLPILLAITLITVLVMAVAGRVTQRLLPEGREEG